jgi:hypothetical protein
MGETARAMHPEFARWYGALSVDNDVDRRTARWAGVCGVVTNVDRARVEALLRLAFGGRATPSPQSVQSIRDAFKAADDAFEMSGNDRELQVLAAAALVVLMQDPKAVQGSAAALAVTTSSFGGARSPSLPMDLAALGEAAIISRGEINLKRPDLNSFVSPELPKVEFDKAVTKVQQTPNWTGVAEAFGLAAESVRAGFGAMARRQAKAMSAVDRFIRAQDEELQMLWWLTGQRSEVCRCAFEEVPADARPLVFASELADCTEFLPGPPSVRGILSRARLPGNTKLAVSAAVNACPVDWMTRLVQDNDPSPLSAPLHAAVKRQLETGAGDAWIAGWAATIGVAATHALPPLTLGELFYRERLLSAFP